MLPNQNEEKRKIQFLFSIQHFPVSSWIHTIGVVGAGVVDVIIGLGVG